MRGVTPPARRAIAALRARLIHHILSKPTATSSAAQRSLVVEMVVSSVEAAKSRKPVDANKHATQSGSCLNMADSSGTSYLTP
jgi:hypothetical protein